MLRNITHSLGTGRILCHDLAQKIEVVIPTHIRLNRRPKFRHICLEFLLLATLQSSLSFYVYQKGKQALPVNLITISCSFFPLFGLIARYSSL
jgi:hypothetical protein